MTGSVHPLDIQAAESRYTRPANGIRPPTRLKGYVEDAAFDGILADVLELVPDVAWPTSVQTYQQMRRDPKLTAILDGYGLQLRRAQWQLDGTGCRPEVVDLVADDMDLPVKGADRNGAARTRGVSWHEHLRSALTMLVFGHSGFELEAAIVEGRARLVGLWDRPQHTIHTIHVEPRRGTFNGISQILGKVAWDEPEIRPERLAWYAHQREGAQWFGTALIRPAFAPWLLKREMQRVLATSSRRFGMGVPTVEWAPTATPTPQQFSEAQKAVTASRVGDQSGMTMPPGALLRLVGMSGGTPDTLAFIKWLDQQMSISVLMQHLDLGQTETGARALGQAFIDLWTLALEAIGEEVADVATRQVAARVAGWNWGTDEPVPRVVVSGVGSRREVTAESLKLLLDSGALSFDPGLEEWVRREYRLPARTTPRPAQVPVHNVAAHRPAQLEAAAEPAPVRYEQPQLPIPGDVVAHLPGRHDQQTHGRRRKAPSAPRLTRKRLVELLSRDAGEGSPSLGRVSIDRLNRLFGELVAENPPNETALLNLNAELERRERQDTQGRDPDPLRGVNLGELSEDQLLDLWSEHRAREDVRRRIDAEFTERRRRTRSVGDQPLVDWGEDTPDSPEQQRIDDLVAQGLDYRDAYADVYGLSEQELRGQERGAVTGRRRDEVRRAYRDFVTLQMLKAESDLRGHLLSPGGRSRGIDPLSLFSGPAARARRWASEDLRRWWADNPRVTFGEFTQHLAGSSRRRAPAETAVFAMPGQVD